MVYTDYVHIIADSLTELHQFARSLDIRYCWFEGTKKGHPHYDIPKKKLYAVKQAVKDGVVLKKTTRQLVEIIQSIDFSKKILEKFPRQEPQPIVILTSENNLKEFNKRFEQVWKASL